MGPLASFATALAGVIVVLGILVGALTGCSDTPSRQHCRDGKRTADVLIVLRDDITLDQQIQFTLTRFTPGQDDVGGVRDFSTSALLPEKPFMYIYTDEPLTPSQVERTRKQAADYSAVAHLDFNVLPVGGFIPSAEC